MHVYGSLPSNIGAAGHFQGEPMRLAAAALLNTLAHPGFRRILAASAPRQAPFDPGTATPALTHRVG